MSASEQEAQFDIPKALEVNFEGIPDELKAFSLWVVWKFEQVERDWKKPPFTPKTGKRASVVSSQTWGSFIDAKRAYETGGFAGVGFVLTGGIVGVDIDHCIHGSSIEPQALHLISLLDTYTELSPTIINDESTGIHMWLRGKLPGKYKRSGNVEMYDTRRYMTLTGHIIHGGRGYLAADQDRLAAAYNEVFVYAEDKENTGGVYGGRSNRYFEYVSDEKALDRAYKAKNGANFARHFMGDYSLWEGLGAKYHSQSNADFVLVH